MVRPRTDGYGSIRSTGGARPLASDGEKQGEKGKKNLQEQNIVLTMTSADAAAVAVDDDSNNSTSRR